MTAVAEDDLLEAARVLLRYLGQEAARALGQGGSKGNDWIDQHQTELSVRRHCKAVRRRMAEGLGGAKMAGPRRYLLTREAMLEEMGQSPKPGLRKALPRSAEPGKTPSGRAAAVQARLEELRDLRRGK